MRYTKGKALPILLLTALSIIWGSSFILIKEGLTSFPPVQVGTIRIMFAFLVMLPIALKYIKTIYRFRWKKILALGLIANFIPAILFAVAETGLKSSLTGILSSLMPIFTLLVGALLFKVAINKRQTTGLVLGFIGSFTLSFVSNNGTLGDFNYFTLFVVAATLFYGISTNMVKAFFQKFNPIILTALTMFSIGPLAIIYLFSTDFLHRLSTVNGAWSSLGFIFLLGAVNTAFAVILFNKLIQITSAVFAASVTYLIPIVAVFWGLIDGEKLFPLHFVGMAFIIAGIYLINKVKLHNHYNV